MIKFLGKRITHESKYQKLVDDEHAPIVFNKNVCIVSQNISGYSDPKANKLHKLIEDGPPDIICLLERCLLSHAYDFSKLYFHQTTELSDQKSKHHLLLAINKRYITNIDDGFKFIINCVSGINDKKILNHPICLRIGFVGNHMYDTYDIHINPIHININRHNSIIQNLLANIKKYIDGLIILYDDFNIKIINKLINSTFLELGSNNIHIRSVRKPISVPDDKNKISFR